MKGVIELVTTPVEQCIEEVCTAIKNFLLQEGGLKNGYETYVEGMLYRVRESELIWLTPSAKKELTEEGKKSRADKLYSELQLILNKHEVSPISITTKDTGWGSRDMEVIHIAETKKKIWLY